ncbi:insulinase family protein, partial [Candidatus Aminicenantes bacterium AC-708-I09]|nr:insulinase family protein [Candidatus Aminicenantes bacterium AC-708-I09]
IELKNGMKVFVMERHNLPLVNIVTAINVGSKDEDELTNGFTHLLEHLILFRGTEKRSGEEIVNEMKAHGAYFNGHTGRDVTTFEISLPSKFFDFAIEIHKEMLFDLKITEEGLKKEKEIVLDEIDSYFDDPEKYGIELMYRQLFKTHPYGFPVYGSKENIKRASIEEIYSYYKKYFNPSNSAICVVGDVDKNYVIEKIKEIYENIPANKVIHKEINPPQPISKSIKSIIYKSTEQAYIIFGIPAPPLGDEDEIPTQILTRIIGSGSSPRLWNALQRRGNLIYNLKMYYIPYKYSGVITLIVSSPSKKIKTVERIIRKVLKEAKISRYSIEEYMPSEIYYPILDELESAKNQAKIAQYAGFEIGLNVAIAVSKFLILQQKTIKNGSFIEKIENVTPTQLRKVAGKYLYRDRYSIVIIYPENENK